MDAADLHRRLEKLGAPAAKREADKIRRELSEQYKQRIVEQEADLRKRAVKEGQAGFRTEMATLQRKLQESERTARRDADRAVKEAVKESCRELESLKQQSGKERAKYAAETTRLQITIDNLSQKLKHQTPGDTGDMCEEEVYAALKSAFPSDDIQRIQKGVRGADILHKVIEAGKEVGRIVYECKNTMTWLNEWISTAKRYRSEYQTPWVIIAAKRLPRGKKSLVVENTIPVINFELTVNLAEIVREAIKTIGQLRLTRDGAQAKADQIFEYVLSDHFASRFKGLGDAVAALREYQNKEKQWHSETWTKQGRLYDDLENGRREIGAQMHAILETPTKPVLKVVGGKE